MPSRVAPGCTPAAPYHHFASKAALLETVALEGFRRLEEVQCELTINDPADLVGRLTRSYIDFARSHRAHYAVMFDALTRAAVPHSDPDLAVAAIATFDHLAGAVASRGVEPATARARALQIWALAHGAVALVDVAGALDPLFTPEWILTQAATTADSIATDD